MRQKTQNHQNQGLIDKKIRFFLQSLCHIPRWDGLVQKTRWKNSHAWAPLRVSAEGFCWSVRLLSSTFFSHKFHKIEKILVLKCWRKKFGPIFECCGSGCLSRIPDPNFYTFRILDPGSRIPEPQTATKERVKKICWQTFFCGQNFHKI